MKQHTFKLWLSSVFTVILTGITTQCLFANPVVTRGPYLQKATSNSIVIHWRTDIASNSKVAFGTDSTALTSVVSDNNSTQEHIVQLSGLSPHTKYYYSIGSTSVTMQQGGQNYFLTSPLPGQTGKYRFWVTGDCGNNSTNQANVRNKYLAYAGNTPTDGWILLGDNAYSAGLDAEYSSGFFNMYQGNIMKNTALWPAPGNHDYANTSARQLDHNIPYYSIFDIPKNGEAGGVPSNTEAYYSYDYGNIHFLSLDSYGKENNSTRLYDTLGAQVQWIKQDLAANTQKWVVVFFHHPPYTMGSHNSDTEPELINVRSNLIRILERMGVDLILCGHSHVYERTKLISGYYGNESSFNTSYNLSQSSGKYDAATSCPYMKDSVHTLKGTVYVVSGSSGQLGGTAAGYPHNAMQYSNATQGGSLVLEVDENRLDAKWLCADGVFRDNFTIIKDANKNKNISVASGNSVMLTASWVGQYHWSNSLFTSRSISIQPSQDTTVIVKDQFQCIADTFHITVTGITPPAVNLSSAVVQAVCAGSLVSMPYTVSGQFQSNNQFLLQLSDASGNFTSPLNIATVNAIADGTLSGIIPAATASGSNYKLRIVSSNPVTTSSSSDVFRIDHGLPLVNLSSSDADNSVCPGTLVSFNASGANSYQFYIDNISQGNASSDNSFSTNALTNGQLIEVKGYNACGTATSSITMTVYVLPAVSFSGLNNSYLNSDAPVILNGIPSGGIFSGPGITGNQFSPAVAGVGGPYTINYTYTDVHGCSNFFFDQVNVNLATGMVEMEGGNEISMYPNPGTDFSKVYLRLNSSEKVELSLVDITGKMFQISSARQMAKGDYIFTISKSDLKLSPGIYFVRISIGKQQKVLRLTFQ